MPIRAAIPSLPRNATESSMACECWEYRTDELHFLEQLAILEAAGCRLSASFHMTRGPLCHARLDLLHVVVRQAEVVADLVHQHVGDDGAERLVVLGPVVEDRAAVEPHHVGHLRRRAVR